MTTSTGVPRLHGTALSGQDVRSRLRSQGPVAWAEIADGVHVLVVTGWQAAREVLTGPAFRKDPGHWEALNRGLVPSRLAYLATPGLHHSDGERHERLRRAVGDCLASVNAHAVRETVRRHARDLIEDVAGRGHLDLMSEYADRVVARTVTGLAGLPPEAADRVRTATDRLADAQPDAATAWWDLHGMVREVLDAKRARPAKDFTSWLLAHPAGLTDDEVCHQVIALILLGAAPTAAWIGTTLHALVADPAYATRLVGGSVTVRAALTETLSRRCPATTMSAHYAVGPTVLHGVRVPPGVPVLVDHAATGVDPHRPGDGGAHDRSHLAWSAGVHRCPAPGLATTIAEAATETAVDMLWDLTAPITAVAGRPSPFRACPAHVGVLFSTTRTGRGNPSTRRGGRAARPTDEE
ncbi:cytochrome P450 [Streptomyces chilikensis]|uniref:cytochrome P450 n=1 Tax=Streptomyces chilikensis TaxID=1194079 RepID=UPI001408B663|nr:cytochrome P450 [Streptomyces chilikensis]